MISKLCSKVSVQFRAEFERLHSKPWCRVRSRAETQTINTNNLVSLHSKSTMETSHEAFLEFIDTLEAFRLHVLCPFQECFNCDRGRELFCEIIREKKIPPKPVCETAAFHWDNLIMYLMEIQVGSSLTFWNEVWSYVQESAWRRRTVARLRTLNFVSGGNRHFKLLHHQIFVSLYVHCHPIPWHLLR